MLLQKVRQVLAKATSSGFSPSGEGGIVTVVATTQLATKMVDSDGSPATFDSGGSVRGIMVPQLGTPPRLSEAIEARF